MPRDLLDAIVVTERTKRKQLEENIGAYARQIAVLRQNAGDGPRRTYGVALGQLVGLRLITFEEYEALMSLPRIER